MFVVGIRLSDQNIFEAQSYKTESEKAVIEGNILNDATRADVAIEIRYMDNFEVENYSENIT